MKTKIKTLALVMSTFTLSNIAMSQTWLGSATDANNAYRTGNVGIGTSTPSEKLDVSGNIVIPFGNFIGTSGTTYKKFLQTGWDSYVNDYLAFYTAGANSANQYEKMRITLDGKIGIGIDRPKARLHVYESTPLTTGSWAFMPLTSVTGKTGSNAFHHNSWLQRNNTGYGDWLDVELVDGISIDVSFTDLNPANNNAPKTWWKRNPYEDIQSWGNGGTTYMSLKQGKLCIGAKRSVAHANAMLSVDGKVVCKDLYVTASSDWPDFVFKADYKLPKLSEIESFYRANGHLPLIPSEKEVKEKGIDVAEMNRLLLLKVEELTILMVEQQKQIDALKNK